MINVAVSVQRSFLFPADLGTTAAFYSDFERALSYLPHLRLVKTFAPNQYRILYSVTESGFYHMDFYCDVQVRYDKKQRILSIAPLTGIPPVPARVTPTSLTGQGYYSSQSVFARSGKQTRVNYQVELSAVVPKRLEWKLIPDWIIERIADNRTGNLLNHMTGHFIARSVKDFQERPLPYR